MTLARPLQWIMEGYRRLLGIGDSKYETLLSEAGGERALGRYREEVGAVAIDALEVNEFIPLRTLLKPGRSRA